VPESRYKQPPKKDEAHQISSAGQLPYSVLIPPSPEQQEAQFDYITQR
jgi:hypothetical protein